MMVFRLRFCKSFHHIVVRRFFWNLPSQSGETFLFSSERLGLVSSRVINLLPGNFSHCEMSHQLLLLVSKLLLYFCISPANHQILFVFTFLQGAPTFGNVFLDLHKTWAAQHGFHQCGRQTERKRSLKINYTGYVQFQESSGVYFSWESAREYHYETHLRLETTNHMTEHTPDWIDRSLLWATVSKLQNKKQPWFIEKLKQTTWRQNLMSLYNKNNDVRDKIDSSKLRFWDFFKLILFATFPWKK